MMKRVRIARVSPKPTVHRIQEIQIASKKPKLLASKIPELSTRKVMTNDNQNNVHATSQILADFFILISPHQLSPAPNFSAHERFWKYKKEAPASHSYNLY
jgi:hypothetical protein